MNNNELSDFLNKKSLHSKFEIKNFFETFQTNKRFKPFMVLNKKIIKYYCSNCQDEQNFELVLDNHDDVLNALSAPLTRPVTRGLKRDDEKDIDFNKYTKLFYGQCLFCSKEKIHFMIRTYYEGNSLFLIKVGEDVRSNKLMKKENNLLTKEGKELYEKGIRCYESGFGIGAYAYLRRTLEKELIQILNEVTKHSYEGVENLKIILNDYKNDHKFSKMTNQAIESLRMYLPEIVKSTLNETYFNKLFSLFSQGIHDDFTEEKCLELFNELRQIFIMLSDSIKLFKRNLETLNYLTSSRI